MNFLPEYRKQRKQYVFVAVDNAPTLRIATDQICAFPIMSSWGNQYIFVIYEYNRNLILVELMKSRKEGKNIPGLSGIIQQAS